MRKSFGCAPYRTSCTEKPVPPAPRFCAPVRFAGLATAFGVGAGVAVGVGRGVACGVVSADGAGDACAGSDGCAIAVGLGTDPLVSGPAAGAGVVDLPARMPMSARIATPEPKIQRRRSESG